LLVDIFLRFPSSKIQISVFIKKYLETFEYLLWDEAYHLLYVSLLEDLH